MTFVQMLVGILGAVFMSIGAAAVVVLGNSQYGRPTKKENDEARTQYRHLVYLLLAVVLYPVVSLSGLLWMQLAFDALFWYTLLSEVFTICKPEDSSSSRRLTANLPFSVPRPGHQRRTNMIAIAVCLVVLALGGLSSDGSSYFALMAAVPLSLLVLAYMHLANHTRNVSLYIPFALFIALGLATLTTTIMGPAYSAVYGLDTALIVMLVEHCCGVASVVTLAMLRGRGASTHQSTFRGMPVDGVGDGLMRAEDDNT